MAKRYVVIWFRHLVADWFIRRNPELKDIPFILASPQQGRMIVRAASALAEQRGVSVGMVVADCRAIFPSLKVFDDMPEQPGKLLGALAQWALRYTPVVATDMPDGLVMDISGCAHLWGGEVPYLNDIITRLSAYGYDLRAGMADTIGAAWAISRFGGSARIVAPSGHLEALLPLPPAALRLPADILQRLDKLGLCQVRSFIAMPRRALSRRFGPVLLMRLHQALGQEIEVLVPICPAVPYQHRLPALEPVCSAAGIEIALEKLLEVLCQLLAKEEKGLRSCQFRCYRIDGNMQQIQVGTNRASRSVAHLFRLFKNDIATIAPGLGIELFIIEACIVEELSVEQEVLWHGGNQNNKELAELLDRVAGKVGMDRIKRYLPAEHYWPERSVKVASSLHELPATAWRRDLPRPVFLLPQPEIIEVTVPIPDYPPMLFHYKGQLHNVVKADGPERIEQEWWIEDGRQRDYYCVEDADGARFWLFRSGLYSSAEPRWFMHGFFA